MNRSCMEFGDSIKDFFILDKNTALLNHGSFGAVSRKVFEKHTELRKQQEFQPDNWMRKHIYRHYEESVKAACKVVNAKDTADLAIVDNATTAIECILNSLNFTKGESILIHDGTYGNVKKKVQVMKETLGITIIKADIKFPVNSANDIVFMYENMVDTTVKLAIVDHITSPTGIVFPVKNIVQALRKLNVMVLIDGAHAPGQVEIDVEQIDADFYVGNFHKWMYAAHTSAFLWCQPKYRDLIKPLLVSNHWDDEFSKRFIYLGTRDITNYFTIPTAIDFHNSLGGIEGITSYTRPLLDWASDYLCRELKTQALAIPSTMRAPNMLVIKYPGSFCWDTVTEVMTFNFAEKYSVQVLFITLPGENVWIRIMANVYNTKNDFIRLGDSILDLMNETELTTD